MFSKKSKERSMKKYKGDLHRRQTSATWDQGGTEDWEKGISRRDVLFYRRGKGGSYTVHFRSCGWIATDQY